MVTLSAQQVKNLLTNAPQNIRIEITKLGSNEYTMHIVNNNNFEHQTKSQHIQKAFNDLVGKRITVSEAAEKYHCHRNTILKWVGRGYVNVLKPGYRMLVDEADVAYCAMVSRIRRKIGTEKGHPLLGDNGSPNITLKHPSLSTKE